MQILHAAKRIAEDFFFVFVTDIQPPRAPRVRHILQTGNDFLRVAVSVEKTEYAHVLRAEDFRKIVNVRYRLFVFFEIAGNIRFSQRRTDRKDADARVIYFGFVIRRLRTAHFCHVDPVDTAEFQQVNAVFFHDAELPRKFFCRFVGKCAKSDHIYPFP